MFSHALSYQSMMPVNAPQVNATTMVVVLINALCIGACFDKCFVRWCRRQST
jgi:hypothetical protein